MLQERSLKQQSSESHGGLGFTVFGILGLGLGLVTGIVLSEMLGNVDSDRFKAAVRRLRDGGEGEAPEPAQIERDLLSALRGNPITRQAEIDVHAFGDGLVELEGTVSDERTRDIAINLASGVAGADAVVNRILVAGVDTHEPPTARMEHGS